MANLLIGARPEIQLLVPDVSRGGFSTVRGQDVRDVLAFLREHTPGLIVLDAALGRGGDGPSALDLCARLRKIARLREVPVVLLLPDGAPSALVAEAEYARVRHLVRVPSERNEVERILFDAILHAPRVA